MPRIGPRLTIAEQAARNPANRGRLLAVEVHTPKGHLLRLDEVAGKKPEELNVLCEKIDGLRKAQTPFKEALEKRDQAIRFIQDYVYQIEENYGNTYHNLIRPLKNLLKCLYDGKNAEGPTQEYGNIFFIIDAIPEIHEIYKPHDGTEIWRYVHNIEMIMLQYLLNNHQLTPVLINIGNPVSIYLRVADVEGFEANPNYTTGRVIRMVRYGFTDANGNLARKAGLVVAK